MEKNELGRAYSKHSEAIIAGRILVRNMKGRS
jgi:hypothetical protein